MPAGYHMQIQVSSGQYILKDREVVLIGFKLYHNNIAFLGLFISIAALLQAVAGFIPGIGHFLSIFSTLPVLIAGKDRVFSGIATYIVASFVIFFIQPLEAPIFIFGTGLLGLVLGICINSGINLVFTTVLSGAILSSGMIALVSIVGIDPFGGITAGLISIYKYTLFFIFSLIYSILWVIAYKKYWG